MEDNFYLSTFETKNKAVYLYSTLENKGYGAFKLVSTPCNIKAGCNYAIRFSNKKYIEIIVREAEELGIEPPTTYYAKKISGKYIYSKLPKY